MIGLSEDGKAGIFIIVIAIEAEAVFAESFRGDVFGSKIAIVKIFSGEFQKTSKIEFIIVNSAARTAVFYF